MALDKDGTQIYLIDSGNNITQCTSGQIQSVTSEANMGVNTNGQNNSGKMAIIFPEKRDLVGCFVNVGSGSFVNGSLTLFEVSTDSTNAIDGTWTTKSVTSVNTTTSPAYRTGIQTVSAAGIKVIRLSFSSGAPSSGCFPLVHLYGNITAGQNPDRLALWHPTLDQQITGAYFDWGDVLRASTADRTFRVKNLSATFTANTITCSLSTLTDTSPTVVGQHTLSNGGAFASTASAGTLAPGAISSVMTVRLTTTSDATLSLWAARIISEAATWS